MSNSGPFYTYQSIPSTSFRLLRLLPCDDEHGPIQCQLFSCSLQDSRKAPYPYDALSYVWGDPSSVKPIYIGEHVLSVTANLHAALSHLRHSYIDRTLWADAVCINQKDNQEKEHQ